MIVSSTIMYIKRTLIALVLASHLKLRLSDNDKWSCCQVTSIIIGLSMQKVFGTKEMLNWDQRHSLGYASCTAQT